MNKDLFTRQSGQKYVIHPAGVIKLRHTAQDQDSLLVKRRNDNHSPGPVIRELVPNSHQQPVEKLTYDKNSSSRFKIIKRHETELKWIKLLQTPFPLGFNDNIYQEGNISKMPDFDVFSLLEI